MSIIVYGVYDSTDAAELSAWRLKRALRGIKISGISKRVMPDESEETTIYAFPPAAMSGNSTVLGFFYPIPTASYIADSVRDPYFEPLHREDVKLRVEADDADTAQSVIMLMRSTGGREIRQVER